MTGTDLAYGTRDLWNSKAVRDARYYYPTGTSIALLQLALILGVVVPGSPYRTSSAQFRGAVQTALRGRIKCLSILADIAYHTLGTDIAYWGYQKPLSQHRPYEDPRFLIPARP
eukprot:1441484-Rhodomonas_salina.1